MKREEVEKIALSLCNLHNPHNGAGEQGVAWCLCDPIADALLAYGEKIRIKTLERAARKCEGVMTMTGNSEFCETVTQECAKRIRALTSQPEDPPE